MGILIFLFLFNFISSLTIRELLLSLLVMGFWKSESLHPRARRGGKIWQKKKKQWEIPHKTRSDSPMHLTHIIALASRDSSTAATSWGAEKTQKRQCAHGRKRPWRCGQCSDRPRTWRSWSAWTPSGWCPWSCRPRWRRAATGTHAEGWRSM